MSQYIYARMEVLHAFKISSYVHASSHACTCLAVSNSSIFLQVRSTIPKPRPGGEFGNFGSRLAFSTNGNYMAVCANVPRALVCPVYVRDTVNGTYMWKSLGLPPIYTTITLLNYQRMAFSSDATTLVMAAYHYTRPQWAIGTFWLQARVFVRNAVGHYVQQKLIKTSASPVGNTGTATASISLSADGNYLALGNPTFSKGAGGVWVYSRQNGQWLLPTTILFGPGEREWGYDVALSGNGQVLAVTSFRSEKVRIYRRTGNTWSETDELTGLPKFGAPNSDLVALSFDGKTLAFGGCSMEDSFVVFRNVDRVWLKTKVTVKGNPTDYLNVSESFSHISVSLDGKTIAAASKLRPKPAVFYLENGMWVQKRGLVPISGIISDTFGGGGVDIFAMSGDGATIGGTVPGGINIYRRRSL